MLSVIPSFPTVINNKHAGLNNKKNSEDNEEYCSIEVKQKRKRAEETEFQGGIKVAIVNFFISHLNILDKFLMQKKNEN